MTKFFKITRDDRSSQMVDGECGIKYALDQWTYPKIPGSKLFVYVDKIPSTSMADGKLLWSCEVLNPVSIEYRASLFDYTVEKFEAFWRNPLGYPTLQRFSIRSIDRIMVCDAVKLSSLLIGKNKPPVSDE